MFQTYEEDFGKLLNSIRKKIQSAPGQSNEVRELAITEGSREVNDAEKCLRQMEIDVASMSKVSQSSLQSVIRKHREDFEEVKRNFRREESKYSELKSKETLMGARFDDGFGNQKEKLLYQQGSLLSQQIMKLEQGKQVAFEAEGVAIQTMNQLKGQREVLERAISNNREIGDNLSQGHRIINTMSRRSIQNKLIMFGIAIMLVCTIIFLVYMKLS